jgi:hypothetical protein
MFFAPSAGERLEMKSPIIIGPRGRKNQENLRIGQSTDAIKALRKAIKLNPEDKRAQSLLDFIASTPEI